MCHYQKNIDILLEKENTLRKLIQLYIEADSFEEHSRLLKSSTIGSLQSLCYYAQGRLFLRRALNENIGEETIEKKFFVLIHGDLLPVPFGVDDNIFSAYAIASSRNDDQAIKKLRRTVEERRQILQRCLGCLLNVSSDPELGAWISGTEVRDEYIGEPVFDMLRHFLLLKTGSNRHNHRVLGCPFRCPCHRFAKGGSEPRSVRSVSKAA